MKGLVFFLLFFTKKILLKFDVLFNSSLGAAVFEKDGDGLLMQLSCKTCFPFDVKQVVLNKKN